MTTSAKVRCCGRLHKITVTPRGALTLHGHHAPTEKAFVALGGEPCRCLEVLQAWRNRDRAKLPVSLRPALDAAQARAKSRPAPGRDRLSVPFLTRAHFRVAKAAEAALESCAYRRSRSKWAGGNHSIAVHIGDAAISGDTLRAWSDNGKWTGSNSRIVVAIPLSWYSRVYRRGLAVVDGVFVLDVLAEDKKGFIVLAGKQGRGFAVTPARAQVTVKGGSLRLSWEKAPKGGK